MHALLIRWTTLTETGSPFRPFLVWFFEGPPFADRDADDCFRGAGFFATREAAEQAAAAWEAELMDRSRPTNMTLLVACGRALYGDRWQSPLARDLGVSDRTMRRWVAGQFPVPEGVGSDLLKLCEARAVKLGQLAKKLEAR